jgi:hypothetical protein
MKNILSIILLALAFAMVAMAADVSGKWSGSFMPEGQEASGAYLVLKQSGSTLTGTAGPDADTQWPITDGKVEGNKLTGVATNPDGVSYRFTLTADGDSIKGNIEVAMGGQTVKATLDVKRVKP